MTPRFTSLSAWLAVSTGILLGPAWIAAQELPVPPAPVDTMDLDYASPSAMEMLYERTVFNVDVLQLQVVFGPATAGQVEHLIQGRDYQDGAADSVAKLAMASRNALVRSRFKRDVGLDRFLEGLRDNVQRARNAGLISAEAAQAILAETGRQYEPFRDRGFLNGESLWYRIRGDSLHLVVQGVDGEILLEDRATGPERRAAILGSYLAPESDFREGLLRSVFKTDR